MTDYKTSNKTFLGSLNEPACKGLSIIGVQQWVDLLPWHSEKNTNEKLILNGVSRGSVEDHNVLSPLIINHQIWTGIALD